ncbi:hypothetical protein DCAR_0936209 [Daucus carota subsp. sativus]|uniref:Uncharacterized protein n=1 Tax=Daucus carota subsp. sativus TaxID=79200 RepID=A0A175YJV2_DAUCS|nr:PREDICTED: probable methyltransferase At1g27930 [Daucus carota subsp. sativus]WOH16651.1 hypothetical protein DCAR_0936209 [Daucus carota subsp. sativus]
MKIKPPFMTEKSPSRLLILAVAILFLFSGALVLSSYILAVDSPFLLLRGGDNSDSTERTQLETILHYATSRVVPQQSLAEIKVSFDVLLSRAPCNFLVFGLGHDSQMWHSFNPRGTTLFLEEDPKWVQTILKTAPFLNARHVIYRTKLSEADKLLQSYRWQPECTQMMFLRGNDKCRLALTELPEEVYDKEWDLIMIDAPRGYFPEAPGRMAAIYSAAVMARNRKGKGETHVFLHDVDRRVEKAYAEEFLCRKYLVQSKGRLWHFEIPSPNTTASDSLPNTVFC